MPRGFSLVEVVVATAVMITATLGLAQLLVMSAQVSRSARLTTLAAVLASQKMEQLQSAGRGELSASPPGTLAASTAGYYELLDAEGRVLAAGASTPSGAAFVRRWAVEPLPYGGALLLQVSVVPVGEMSGETRGEGDSSRRREEARFVGIKTRAGG